MIGQAVALLGIFVAGVLVARTLGPKSFGMYSTAFALGSLIVGGGTVGIPLLILRRAAEGDLDRRILRKAALLLVCFLAVAIVVTIGIAAALFGGLEGAFAGSAAALFFASNNFASLGRYVHVGRRSYFRSAATDICAGTLFPVLTYAALKLNFGVDGSLIAIATACCISCSIAWTRLPSLEPDGEPTHLSVRDGMSFNMFGLVSGGYGRIDTVTMLAVAGSGAAGYYSAAYRILGPFTLLRNATTIFYFSRLSAYCEDKDRWLSVRKRARVIVTVTGVSGMAIFFAAAPSIIHAIYGSHYDQSIGPARVLLLSIVPWSFYILEPTNLASVHLELRATAATTLGLIVDFFLVIALGRHFGPIGGAWAWVISESAILIALKIASRRISDRVPLAASDTAQPLCVPDLDGVVSPPRTVI
jgi:O-antigen/teichoic acid export membrane protein